MAVLLFPFGLRLGLMLQCPRGYWPVLLGAEWLLIYWLMQAVGLTHFSLLMIGSLLTLLPVALDEEGWYYSGDLCRMDEAGYIKTPGRTSSSEITKGFGD